MPLYAKKERVTYALDGFDQTIAGNGGDTQECSGIFDSLVMKTVDLDLFADQSGKKGVLLGEYQMSGIVPGDRSRIVIETGRRF